MWETPNTGPQEVMDRRNARKRINDHRIRIVFQVVDVFGICATFETEAKREGDEL
jgi:hypothetical protein